MSFSSPWLLAMNACSVSIAILEATSPALWPPMPSHTAYRFVSRSIRRLSSFSLRRRPTSVLPNASIMNSPGRRCRARIPSRLGPPQHGDHLPDGALHADEHRAGDDVVPDVQLRDLRYRGHARSVRV